MKLLLDKWEPNKRFGKITKRVLNIVLLILFLAFIVIPFLRLDNGWKEAFKWKWIGIAILHLDQFAGYKKAREEKLIYPIFSLIATLTLFYLCNYWSLIPLCVAIVCSIVIGLLEFGISVKVYEAMRFTAKAELRSLPLKATDTILLGSVYASAVSLFILGHFLSETMIFVFGIITMIMLFSSVISVISKGFSSNKSIVTTIIIILDIISVLALIGYLIYLTPKENSLQDIVLSLTSAVIGGALTLAGVAWTIKKTDDDRKADSIIHATPYLQINNYKRSEVACTKVITVEELRGGAYFQLLITNIGMELCFIKYVQSHGEYIHIENAHIAPNDTVRLDLHLKHFSLEALIVSDRMSNHYKLSISTPDNRLYSIGLPQKFDTGTIGEEK